MIELFQFVQDVENKNTWFLKDFHDKKKSFYYFIGMEMKDMKDIKDFRKNYRFKKETIENLKEMSKELGLSETAIIEQLVNNSTLKIKITKK